MENQEERKKKEEEKEREEEKSAGMEEWTQMSSSSSYKPSIALNTPPISLITIQVKWMVIWTNSRWMESIHLRKLTYSSRYTLSIKSFRIRRNTCNFVFTKKSLHYPIWPKTILIHSEPSLLFSLSSIWPLEPNSISI